MKQKNHVFAIEVEVGVVLGTPEWKDLEDK
jgi:hypothetical protein